jgi:hypothetical protein
MEGYHQEPLASPNPHKGRVVLTKNSPQRRGKYKRSRTLHTKRALNGRCLTVQKQSSSKSESMPGDASSALEMKEMDGSHKASQSHTLNHFLTQALAQRNQDLALRG